MMKSSFRMIAATAFLLVAGLFAPVQAATVTATNPVTFEFDVSGFGALTATNFRYSCFVTPSCSGGGGGTLLSGASVTLDFGTPAGASDIGTSSFTNPSFSPINNVRADLIQSQSIAALLNSVFVTFNFVDDEFDIDTVGISGTGFSIDGTLVPAVAVIPLPAGMFLLLGALGGLGLARRRGKKRPA